MGKPTRVPEIDGLRGMAVVAVIFCHYFTVVAEPGSTLAYVMTPFRLAWTGVDLFFVVSGYLIGGILVSAKGSENYFRTFFVRRFCRILPLYLALLALFAVAARIPALYGSQLTSKLFPAWVYLTFTQNLGHFLHLSGDFNGLAVTWSLAVEEQFYLTLPLVIWLLPARALPVALAGATVLAPVLRVVTVWGGLVPEAKTYFLPFCRMDALALGVLAALLVRSPRGRSWLTSHRRLMHLGLGLTAVGMALVTYGKPTWLFHQNYTLIALFYVCLLLAAASYPDGRVARLVRMGWLRRAGVLCYGLYLFHIPALFLAYLLIGRGDGLPKLCDMPSVLASLAALLATCVLASLSWRYFEEPFVRLGHRWTYRGEPSPGRSRGSGAQHMGASHGLSHHQQLS